MITKLDLKFKINDDGYLLVSYDAGCTWEIIGPVRGDASTVEGPQGEQGPAGRDGQDGQNGQDGQTPYIGENNHWWVGDYDTGILATGNSAEIEIERSEDIDDPSGAPSVSSRKVGNTTYIQFHSLKGDKGDDGATGEQGAQGIKGDKGDPGPSVHWVEHQSDCAEMNDAFVDSNGDMYVRVSPAVDEETQEVIPWDEADYVYCGNVKGPQGVQGPRGPQGHPIYFTDEATYDSDAQRAIFNIPTANVGDYLIYTGTNDAVAPAGQLFQLQEGLDAYDRQVWIDQEFNIRGPKGDVLNAEGLVPTLRLTDVIDQDYPPMSYQKLQASFDGFQTVIELGILKCRSIRTIYQISGLPDEDTYYTFRVEYTDGTNYDLKIKPNGTGRNGRGYVWTEETNSFAEGEATGDPDPNQPLALGNRSHAEGKSTVARGINSHAEGLRRNAFGAFSHAEGASQSDTDSIEVDTVEEEELTSFEAVGSSNPYQVDIQIDNGATEPSIDDYESILLFYRSGYTNPSDQAVITNYESEIADDIITITLTLDKKVGDLHWSLTDGNRITLCTPPQNKALSYGTFSHTEGFNTSAIGIGSHAEGDTTVSLGDYSHAEGENCKALGDRSHAEGDNTKAYGFASHTEGKKTEAYYFQSHAEGNESKAIAKYSHAEGNKSTSSGTASHAEGEGTTASGNKAHAEGNYTTASGASSHAEGSNTVASGAVSHASGKGTIAACEAQFVAGMYNVADTNNKYAFILGKGSSDSDRQNLLAIGWDGIVYGTKLPKLSIHYVSSTDVYTTGSASDVYSITTFINDFPEGVYVPVLLSLYDDGVKDCDVLGMAIWNSVQGGGTDFRIVLHNWYYETGTSFQDPTFTEFVRTAKGQSFF